ncbi:hypothetical protein LO762_09530 [Actinocorallia sp. API 0066]|uniref:hypothetical protein n=1 Tax=Actinocorallia sp. API 0066 TaxID=2896846 RepID=UPI001E32ACC1|nr:hypothetical protein [Actinocorallia sp. API 0066]MCD0449428.1 hypothetical protein [Actinocorallia sp. API 0066]
MDSYVTAITHRIRRMPEPVWLDVPLSGERLAEIVFFGHGKDADLMIRLRDERKFVIPMGDRFRLSGCDGLRHEIIPWDDRSLAIRYSGENLELAALRIEIPRWAHTEDEDFEDAVRRWLEDDEELPACLQVDIHLRHQPPEAKPTPGGGELGDPPVGIPGTPHRPGSEKSLVW